MYICISIYIYICVYIYIYIYIYNITFSLFLCVCVFISNVLFCIIFNGWIQSENSLYISAFINLVFISVYCLQIMTKTKTMLCTDLLNSFTECNL